MRDKRSDWIFKLGHDLSKETMEFSIEKIDALKQKHDLSDSEAIALYGLAIDTLWVNCRAALVSEIGAEGAELLLKTKRRKKKGN